MTIELNMLRELTEAIDAVTRTAAAAADAFKVAYAAPIAQAKATKGALTAAEGAAAHARYEYVAVLSAARAHVALN